MASFVIVILFSSLVKAQTDPATEIDTAKSQILTCYQAAKNAEAAGANITQLTSTLNEAQALLTSAQQAYQNNDNVTALELALQSQAKLVGFVSEANDLEQNAINERNLDFWLNIVGSIVGALAVVFGSVAVWFLFKKKYAEKIS